MILYQDENRTVRTIEDGDCGAYLKLFNEEDFGCVSMNSNLKPSLYEEQEFLRKVIDKDIIDEEVLVIEEDKKIIGYVTISRPKEDLYHLGNIAIRKEYRNKGFGSLLLNVVKQLASQDKCDIKLECINGARTFFEHHGFSFIAEGNYIYKSEKDKELSLNVQMGKHIFPDYDMIEEERNKQTNNNISEFKTFLDSPIYKILTKL